MNLERLKKLHEQLLEIGNEAHREHDQEGIYAIGPVLGWLLHKIDQASEEALDGARQFGI